jgi:Ca-activated chloride channel family protein
VLAYRTSRQKSGIDLIASKEPREDGYAMLTLTAGDELGDSTSGMDYVFILDISGSMNDDGKLGLSRGSLSAFIQALGEEDRFEVLTFNVAANGLFSDLRATDDTSRSDAAEFLRRQNAKGGTFLEPALRAAYGYKDPDRVLNVVVLSDGMTEQRERRTLLRLIGERPGSTRVFAIGVGNDVNRPLLDQLAKDAGGLAAFISRGDDFERQAKAFRRKLMRPVLTDVVIEAEGGGLYDVEPRQLPNLYHGMPVRLYARYLSAGPLELKLTGNLGGELLERSFTLELPGSEAGSDAENPEIERMWAFKRVERLLEDADRTGERQDVVDEIIRLGEGYSIVTEYTSFLVLENDDEYRRWKIERRNATRIERDRGKQVEVRARLAALRNQVSDRVGPAERATADADVERADSAGGSNPAPSRSPGRSADIDFRGEGGGGALDPLSVGLMLGLGAASYSVLRRKRRR